MVNIIYAPKKLNEPKAGQRQIDLETSYSQCWTKKYFENSKRKTADHKLVAGNTIKINNWLLTAIAEWHRVVKLFKWKTLKDVIFRKAVFQEWRWSEAFLEEQELGERIAAGYALDRVLAGKWTWRNCLMFFSSLFFFWLSKLGVSLCKMVEGEALEVFPSTTAKHRLGGPTAIHYFGTGESAGIFTRGDENKAWGRESWRGWRSSSMWAPLNHTPLPNVWPPQQWRQKLYSWSTWQEPAKAAGTLSFKQWGLCLLVDPGAPWGRSTAVVFIESLSVAAGSASSICKI